MLLFAVLTDVASFNPTTTLVRQGYTLLGLPNTFID